MTSHNIAESLTRTIAVVTGSRADYGLYRSLLTEIERSPQLKLRLMVCGMHLSPAFGSTVRRIEQDGFPIADRIETSTGFDTPEAIAASIARGVSGFAAAFTRTRSDIVVLLGDRYEMLAAAVAALPFALPIAHIHGGELTEGAIDDAIRHSLTKLSHLHFVSTEVYRHRVIQMGEQPDRVFVSGAPGLDAVRTTSPTPRAELERRLGITFETAPLLVTFHPTTLEYTEIVPQTRALLAALEAVARPIVFTYPSADTAADRIITEIDSFVRAHPNVRLVKDLGTIDYFGMMATSAAMVGNSSSGIIEAPSFGLPVVNIGSRQRGRLRAANVIDCAADSDAIAAAINQATSQTFRNGLKGLSNPYGDGRAAARIVAILQTIRLNISLVEKRFFDISGLSGILPAGATP